ncbi:MAG: family 43 glycosylhydrolase [Nocardioides sp.]
MRRSGSHSHLPALVLAALALLAPLLPMATSSAAPADRETYRNPLAPRIPGGGTVDSCADPAVQRGQGDDHQFWYLYCTTDPLNDQDLDRAGNLRFHPIPTMRSRDLVNWKYVGDALPEPPEWAADGAGLWAPDVSYSPATRRYYLSFVVTNTDDSLRGENACASDGDSAIGVAVSDSPTGPWKVSDKPVVGPRPDPQSACSFFWTFDPDVLVTGTGAVLYYGSYYGGVHAVDATFDKDGITTVGPSTRVTIGNRYEGTHVVQRRGWYYLFASATNCCNGPLTSYGVFAGRSRDPHGPFVDRDGRSLLAGRVGGTPVLLPNGNRWVGVGHNTVLTDDAGQWWTIYHAVDEDDPYFESDPGFTRRPAMLDALTWRNGWPAVRAGRWASDSPVPAPSTDGEPNGPLPGPPAPLEPGRVMPAYSDDFEDGLDPAWTWVREPDPGTFGAEPGALRWDTQAGDLAREVNTASVLTRPEPAGDHVVETRVQLDLPPEGCCQNFVQAGLVLYDGDDRYLKLVHVSIWETRQTEWAKEVPAGAPEFPRYGNGVVGPPGDTTRLRVVVERVPGPDRYTAFTRSEGGDWVRGGVWRHDLGPDARIGLVSMGGEGYTARFLDVTTSRLR